MELGMGKKARYYLIAKYKPDENNDEKVKILDRYFIKKNKDKAKIIYKNKIYELKEYFEDIDTNYNHKDLIKIKIIFIHNIINMSYMFYDCYTLISLYDNNEISNIKIYITNSYCMFVRCNLLISLPDISKWNTSNVKNMNFMFYECNSLISLPDISNWNLSRVISMSHMFCGCKSLISLPDFYMLNKYKNYIIFEVTYKKNEGKVKILGYDFIKKNNDNGSIIYNNSEFELKEYFEDNDKMNKDTFKLLICLDKNIEDISNIFYECKSLISIDYYQINNKLDGIDEELNLSPHESKTNQSHSNNNENLSDSNIYLENSNENSTILEVSEQKNANLFSSKENFQFYIPLSFNRITNMMGMFYKCNSLISLPDISKWNTSNVNNMSWMFTECKSLISLPDISNWNTSNVNDMSRMFYECN